MTASANIKRDSTPPETLRDSPEPRDEWWRPTAVNKTGAAFGRLTAASEPTGLIAGGALERIGYRERMMSLGPVGLGRFGTRWDVI